MTVRRTLAAVVLILGSAVIAGGSGVSVAAPVAGPAPAGVAPVLGATPTPRSVTAAGQGGGVVPVAVHIARIGVDAPVEPLGLAVDGTLEVPRTYTGVGWYRQGVAPGGTGPAVLAGHVDSYTGPAVFFRLVDLRAGDRIEVRSAGGGTQVFVVTEVARYAKNQFPTARVYGPTAGAELRLITCGGTFDAAARSYRDNVVVFAIADPDRLPFLPGG